MRAEMRMPATGLQAQPKSRLDMRAASFKALCRDRQMVEPHHIPTPSSARTCTMKSSPRFSKLSY